MVPSFYFYQLADAISGPYTSLKAYSAGAIDANGNILKPESSIDPFEYLVIKLKQIFEQLPYGGTKAKLQSYLSTLQLFSEEFEKYDIKKEQFHFFVEGVVSLMTNGEISYISLLEDTAIGGGGGMGTPAGGSVVTGGVVGFDPKISAPLLKRKTPKFLDNCEVFDLCPEEYASFKMAKTWNQIPDSATKNYIQRFARRNKGSKIGVRTLMPETGDQDLFWINYPAKSFLEEYNLSLKYFNLE
jgi:hypothetical protein